METHSVTERIEAIASEAAKKMGVEFLHAEVVGTKRNITVRVFIDKPDGVSIEDCSNVSREMETVLDADDFIPAAYVLEVSSPGIERQLYSIADFNKFAGQLAKIKTTVELEGQKNFTGTIRGSEGETIIFDDTTKGTVQIPYSSISKANLKIDLGKEFKKARPRKGTP